MIDEELPPARPRIEQFAEKVGAIAIIVLVVGLFTYAVLRTRSLSFGFLADEYDDLLWAAGLTLFVTVASYFVGMGLGFGLAILRTRRLILVRVPATVWVESIRGTPLFVQILLWNAIFSVANPGDLPLSLRVLVTGFFALSLNTGAYQAEIFRAGLQSVPVGQVDAARAVGFSYWGAMRSVIMPQALRLVTPPLLNEFLLMLKASSLLAIVNVRELTYYAKTLTTQGNFLEVYGIVTLLYLVMTLSVAKGVQLLERRYRIPGLGLAPAEARGKRGGGRDAVARTFGVAGPIARLVAARSRATGGAVANVLTRHPDASAAHGPNVRGGGRGHRPEAGPDRRPGVRIPLPP